MIGGARLSAARLRNEVYCFPTDLLLAENSAGTILNVSS